MLPYVGKRRSDRYLCGNSSRYRHFCRSGEGGDTFTFKHCYIIFAGFKQGSDLQNQGNLLCQVVFFMTTFVLVIK